MQSFISLAIPEGTIYVMEDKHVVLLHHSL